MSASEREDKYFTALEEIRLRLGDGKRSRSETWQLYGGQFLLAFSGAAFGVVTAGYLILQLYVGNQLGVELEPVHKEIATMTERVNNTRSDLKDLEKATSNLAPLAAKVENTYALLNSNIDKTNRLIESTNSEFQTMSSQFQTMSGQFQTQFQTMSSQFQTMESSLSTINERVETAQSTADQAKNQVEVLQVSVAQEIDGIQAGILDSSEKFSQIMNTVTNLEKANVFRDDSAVALRAE